MNELCACVLTMMIIGGGYYYSGVEEAVIERSGRQRYELDRYLTRLCTNMAMNDHANDDDDDDDISARIQMNQRIKKNVLLCSAPSQGRSAL